MMDSYNKLIKKVRKLARSFYWQNLYIASQECNGIKLFENESNFSGLQLMFLYWLRTYKSLYEGLALEESPYLTENVIEDDLRCDAYLMFRNELRKKAMEEKVRINSGGYDNVEKKTFETVFRR